jgi:HAD superfamily hydrolase (TIGR01549 family)
MRFFKAIKPIKAISFDLDDTLYENWPIIEKAEQAQLAFLHQQIKQIAPESQKITTAAWLLIRHQLLREHPELHRDIGLLRRRGIFRLLTHIGIDKTKAKSISEQAFEVFYQKRIAIDISADVLQLLQRLAERYPLIALSNGNADITAMGLNELFTFAIHAGDQDVRQKPYPDMFFTAAQRLNISPSEILHIGDSLKSDVQGALNAGSLAVWFNPEHKPLSHHSGLPHLEIAQLANLELLL